MVESVKRMCCFRSGTFGGCGDKGRMICDFKMGSVACMRNFGYVKDGTCEHTWTKRRFDEVKEKDVK